MGIEGNDWRGLERVPWNCRHDEAMFILLRFQAHPLKLLKEHFAQH